jgi:transcriptional regulator GlxA family with amidase domain
MGQPRVRTVGILVFDEVEVLDFCGPFEVFSVARPEGEHGDEHRLFNVLTVAEERRTVSCRGGLLVEPHHDLADHPALDVLVVPGGAGVRRVFEHERLLDWIAARAGEAEVATSVCTGALLLAKRGLLDGLRATTHWGSIGWMRERFPAVAVVDDARYVDAGRVVTAAGVSAGIDMSLHVVARLHGEATADWTARRMEYDRHVPAAIH